MKVIIERFEDIFAVCEKKDGQMIDIKRIDLPFEAKERDVLSIVCNTITIDIDGTEKRCVEIEKLTKDLWLN